MPLSVGNNWAYQTTTTISGGTFSETGTVEVIAQEEKSGGKTEFSLSGPIGAPQATGSITETAGYVLRCNGSVVAEAGLFTAVEQLSEQYPDAEVDIDGVVWPSFESMLKGRSTSGRIRADVPGVLKTSIAWRFEMGEGQETVSVPAGTFEAIRASLQLELLTLKGPEVDEEFREYFNRYFREFRLEIYFAHGIGIIRFDTGVPMTTTTMAVELVSYELQ